MADLHINEQISIPEQELDFSAIRAQGPGGQNVNKVSSAVHLRFDVAASSLPEAVKQRILRQRDRRLSSDGVIVIKAQQYRSQEKNKNDATQRLREILLKALVRPKVRKPTKPSRTARKKRMDSKTRRGHVKTLRGKVGDD
jgi:ribosome-associated protein